MAKRSLDIAVSLVALILLFPFLLVVALAVKLFSPGPVFYLGRRVGRHGCIFRMLKFRTMVVNAEKLGGSATAGDDPRLTRVGILLRRYKLDELPQFWNVLVGDMSLVGPRPEVQKYVDRFDANERRTLQLRPGITDWASIWNADEGAVLAGSPDPEKTYEEVIRPTKLRLQLHYLDNQSIAADIRILAFTAARLLGFHWVPPEIRAYPPPAPPPDCSIPVLAGQKENRS